MSADPFAITGAVAASIPTHWIKRKIGQCAWPIGDGMDLMSCCAPVTDGVRPYCDEHISALLLPTREACEIVAALMAGVTGIESPEVADIKEINAEFFPENRHAVDQRVFAHRASVADRFQQRMAA